MLPSLECFSPGWCDAKLSATGLQFGGPDSVNAVERDGDVPGVLIPGFFAFRGQIFDQADDLVQRSEGEQLGENCVVWRVRIFVSAELLHWYPCTQRLSSLIS